MNQLESKIYKIFKDVYSRTSKQQNFCNLIWIESLNSAEYYSENPGQIVHYIEEKLKFEKASFFLCKRDFSTYLRNINGLDWRLHFIQRIYEISKQGIYLKNEQN